MAQRGTYISGLGHGAFILWALVGGFFVSARDPMPVQSSDVSLITNEQFAALTLPDAAPEIVQETTQPETPEIDDTPPDIVLEPVPVQPAPVPDANPALPKPADDAPPKPAPAPRIAPIAAPAPPLDADIAETATPEVVPDDGAQTPAEEAPATAPQEAATEIVTEAERPAAAPDVSPRPTARPSPPVQAVEATPQEAEPVEQALAEATQTQTTEPDRPTGPPLTQGQIEGFRVAVGACWNVDSGSAAAQVTVTIGFSLDRQGKVEGGSLEFIDGSAGDQAAVDAAYESARRAIIRCGIRGYDLPLEKYERWKDIEMTFNPEGMRIR